MFKIISRRCLGFTLLEVLISMIIMAIGLLGLGLLQGRALKSNKDAYLYGQANFLIYEMADRIKANKAFWGVATNTVPTIPSARPTQDCSSEPKKCTPSQMAAYDMYYWQSSAAEQLPGVSAPEDLAQINVPKIERVPLDTPATTTCPATNATSLCLTLTWTRVESNITGLTTATQRLGVSQ